MNREDFLKMAYEDIKSDLKFAETKNTFLSTFNLAIIGASISFLYGDNELLKYEKWNFIIFSILILISTVISIYSFTPLNSADKCFKRTPSNPSSTTNTTNAIADNNRRFMFYKYIFNNYEWHNKNGYETFFKDVKDTLGGNDLSIYEKQLALQIVDLSHIANTKFTLFTWAIRIEALAFLVLALFFI